MDVGKWAFDNKKLVYFLIVVLLVGGLYSAYDMSKLEDPEIKVKMAMVVELPHTRWKWKSPNRWKKTYAPSVK